MNTHPPDAISDLEREQLHRELDMLLDLRASVERESPSNIFKRLRATAARIPAESAVAYRLHAWGIAFIARVIGRKTLSRLLPVRWGTTPKGQRDTLRSLFVRLGPLLPDMRHTNSSLTLTDLLDELSAAAAGDRASMFRAVGGQKKSEGRHAVALFKLIAVLWWRAFERTEVRKSALDKVAAAFGVDESAIRKEWEAQCRTILGDWRVDRALREAESQPPEDFGRIVLTSSNAPKTLNDCGAQYQKLMSGPKAPLSSEND